MITTFAHCSGPGLCEICTEAEPKPCPHNWVPCEWEYDYTYSSKDVYRSDFAVNSSDNIPYDVRRLTKLYCTLCDTRKDVQ